MILKDEAWKTTYMALHPHEVFSVLFYFQVLSTTYLHVCWLLNNDCCKMEINIVPGLLQIFLFPNKRKGKMSNTDMDQLQE